MNLFLFWSVQATAWYKNCTLWHYLRNYFPINLVKTANLNPSKNYIFCSFPHGVAAFGTSIFFTTASAICEQIFPGLDFKVITLDSHFCIPFYREFVLSLGEKFLYISKLGLKYILIVNCNSDSNLTRGVCHLWITEMNEMILSNWV